MKELLFFLIIKQAHMQDLWELKFRQIEIGLINNQKRFVQVSRPWASLSHHLCKSKVQVFKILKGRWALSMACWRARNSHKFQHFLGTTQWVCKSWDHMQVTMSFFKGQVSWLGFQMLLGDVQDRICAEICKWWHSSSASSGLHKLSSKGWKTTCSTLEKQPSKQNFVI